MDIYIYIYTFQQRNNTHTLSKYPMDIATFIMCIRQVKHVNKTLTDTIIRIFVGIPIGIIKVL